MAGILITTRASGCSRLIASTYAVSRRSAPAGCLTSFGSHREIPRLRDIELHPAGIGVFNAGRRLEVADTGPAMLGTRETSPNEGIDQSGGSGGRRRRGFSDVRQVDG